MSVFEGLRALPRPVWILFAGSFVNRFGSFVLPFLILYLTSSGYSTTQAGVGLASYGLGAFLAAGVGGLVADRLGRRNTIVLSMFGGATSMVLLSQARSFGLIVGGCAVAGLFAEMYRPATSALVTDLIPPERRVTGFAAYRLFINLGFAAGPATAGFIARESYTALFIGDAITSVVFGVVALLMLPQGVVSARSNEVRGEGLRVIARDRSFLLFLAASLFGAFVYFQGEATLPLHVKAAGLSEAVYGVLISINGLVVVLLELFIAARTQSRDPRTVIVVGYVLLGVGFTMTGLFDSALLLGGTVVIWTLGEVIGAPVGSAYVAALAPEHLRGRYQGALGSTYSIALMMAPLIGTPLFAAKPMALWALCGALCAAAAVCVALIRPPSSSPAAVAEEALGAPAPPPAVPPAEPEPAPA